MAGDGDSDGYQLLEGLEAEAFKAHRQREKSTKAFAKKLKTALNHSYQNDYDEKTRDNLVAALKAWNAAHEAYKIAKAAVEEVDDYAGGPKNIFEDDTTHSFADYEAVVPNLVEATNAALEAIKALREARKEVTANGEWDLTPGYLKRLFIELTEQATKLGTVDLAKLGRKAEKRVEKKRRQALDELDNTWVGYWTLGQGGFGRADLWLKRDANNTIVDRIVIKDSLLSPENWNNLSLWHNGPPTSPTSIPIEILALYNLRGKIGSSGIIKIRNWKISRERRMHRTYTEFCGYGDLFQLIQFEHVYGASQRFYLEDGVMEEKVDEVLGESVFVPEPWLWFCFETLVRVGMLMERGEVDRGGLMPWEGIVHRDLKLNNLFVGTNSSGIYRGYAELKLGDFGISIMKPADDARAPLEIRPMGTKGNQPPEQRQFLWRGWECVPLSSKTNVWGIGIIMWSLIACDEGNHTAFPERTDFPPDDGGRIAYEAAYLRKENFIPPDFDRVARKYYSEALQRLIHKCLAFDVDERPNFDYLMKKIRFHTKGRNDKSRGLRDAEGGERGFTEGEYAVQWTTPDAVWKSGMALRDVTKEPEEGSKWPSENLSEGGERDSDEDSSDSSEDDDVGGRPGAELRREGAGGLGGDGVTLGNGGNGTPPLTEAGGDAAVDEAENDGEEDEDEPAPPKSRKGKSTKGKSIKRKATAAPTKERPRRKAAKY